MMRTLSAFLLALAGILAAAPAHAVRFRPDCSKRPWTSDPSELGGPLFAIWMRFMVAFTVLLGAPSE